MKNKLPLPTICLATGVSGLATYLTAISSNTSIWKSFSGQIDHILDTGALLQLMSIALTAGSLVLAAWGMIKSQQSAIISTILNITDKDRSAVLQSIDDFLSASIDWFLSFSAFAISYLLILALDDIVDIKTVTVINGFTIPGFRDFLEVLGEATAAPALFLVGIVLLVTGTWKTIFSLHRLAPHLRNTL